jgi:hypothetical protein
MLAKSQFIDYEDLTSSNTGSPVAPNSGKIGTLKLERDVIHAVFWWVI